MDSRLLLSLRWRRATLVGLTYFVVASLTIAWTRVDGGVAVLWAASAILFAELSITTRRSWLPVLVTCGAASFAATSLFGFGVAAALPLVAINLLEPVVGGLVMRRLNRQRGPLESLHGVAVFLLASGIIAPALSAFGGASIAAIAGGGYWINWVTWYVGHALGTVTFTPLAVLLLRGDAVTWLKHRQRSDTIEAITALGLVLISCITVFAQSTWPLLFLPSLPIIIATFRTGRAGAAISVIMLAIIGGWATLSGVGPISLIHGGLIAHLQFFQFYLAVTVLTALPVAAELNNRKRIYDDLQRSESRYRLVTDNATDIVMNIDQMGVIRYVSPSIAKLGGYSPAQVLGRSSIELVHHEDRDKTRAAHLNALADPAGTQTVEYRGILADGSLRWFETHTRAVRDERGHISGVVSAVRDISRRKALEARLSHDAKTDYLTGLCNRRCFMDALDSLLAQAPEAAGCLAMFDIDFFKRVNDQHGHAAGDEVLKGFASIAKRAVRDSDLVARLGGEEFAVLLRGATVKQAMAVCDRLRTNVAAAPVGISASATARITVSAGVVEMSAGKSADTLLTEADEALYRAKRSGRNRLELAA